MSTINGRPVRQQDDGTWAEVVLENGQSLCRLCHGQGTLRPWRGGGWREVVCWRCKGTGKVPATGGEAA